MRFRLSIIFLLLATYILQAQTNLVAYEYWFNQDYGNVQVQPITPAPQHTFSGSIDVSSLPNNVNVLNFRYKDANGVYSSTLSKIFVKLPPAHSATASNLVSYEYWFNNDYTNVQVQSIAPTQQHSFVGTIDVSSLPNNVNVLNFRYKDASGVYSSTLSKIFVKLAPTVSATPNIVAYEYWFNQDYANAQVQTITPTQQHNFVGTIDVSSLPNSVNVLNIRYKDERGVYSSTLSKIFVKLPQTAENNKIVGFHYWFNDDFASRRTITLTSPAKQVNILDVFDVTRITKGNYRMYYQFIDSMGVWSVVNHHDFVKNPFPISEFSYETTVTCDSTVVAFTNTSIDGDTTLWNFGDGTTSSAEAPTHAYRTPGTYVVSLTVRDTATMADSTTTQTIHVSGITHSTISPTVCDSYTSPSGKVFTQSGMYLDTILNHWNCDSIITINLTVKYSTTSVDTHTVCDGPFTWIDGNTYTTSNNTATHTIPNAVGCDSVITLNLTVNPLPDVTVLQQGENLLASQEGATYQWLNCDNGMATIDGATERYFVATEIGNYAVEVTLDGCVDTSACYSVTEVGIIETTFDSEILLYPNPTDGVVRIDLGERLAGFSLSVCDITGRVVMQRSYRDVQSFELNLDDVQSGVYLVRIDSGSRKATLRVIKR